MLKNCFLIILLLLTTISTAKAAEWSQSEIRAVGKNLISLASFYNTCGNQKLVNKNIKAIRWAGFMGIKYLIVAGIEEEEKLWIENGAKGILVYDPETSEEAVQVEFSFELCNNVKNHLDANYEIVDDFISTTN